jgi:endonuclease III
MTILSSMGSSVSHVLEQLETFYGQQEPTWPTDPYLFLIWWHCGYPASDSACAKGWESLKASVGVTPAEIMAAPAAKLTKALTPGGMVPAVRAQRLKEIAERIEREHSGDLHALLTAPLPQARKALKKFPNIADPGADRILLFAGIAPIPAVPSNCPHVLVRILRGVERENYGLNYQDAQRLIETEVAANISDRTRAFLLLKRHDQELRKRQPKCESCPVNQVCAYHEGNGRGRG